MPWQVGGALSEQNCSAFAVHDKSVSEIIFVDVLLKYVGVGRSFVHGA